MVHAAPMQKSSEYLLKLRREAGAWLMKRRVAAGLTQKDLAKLVGLDYYTFISAMENGRQRVPPERYETFARALQMEPHEFAKVMLRYDNPEAFRLLFGKRGTG
jgi:transcriptional regulator with XRE-family HTH domain